MPLRLIEIRLPGDRTEEVSETLAEIPLVEKYSMKPANGRQIWHILAFGDQVEAIVDALEDNFSLEEGFRIIVFNIEAAIPHPEEEVDGLAESGERLAPASDDKAPINIEELYDDVTHGMSISWPYVTMIAVSAVVAAVGIYRDDIIMVIAAMIIAPLLSPAIALALATAMADLKLGKRAIKVGLLGSLVAVVVSIGFGVVMPFEPSAEMQSLRIQIGVLDVVVAASAGIAGTLSFTGVKPGGVVGVMIAVALVPPLVSFGMLVGAGYLALAVGPLLLSVINTICINLAGVVTFAIQRVEPRKRWEEERASKALRQGVVLWLVLLAALAAAGYFAGDYWRAFW
ncbi:TIGR00341 family protein [Persicimonas caeni]|uniref:TIGR00341 family protein n=1 Tax=Persicimonas caeni TaxID=2292766 RepID=A0A4Y6PQ77_PERCE|nr:TIGR00341 family protein [Persicimonas caeni]QDG50430.1 TIGR00341 family protein [Persicimonas caeni]QED31651.1 TIGR00341 family protein [Persicimonas caeni]